MLICKAIRAINKEKVQLAEVYSKITSSYAYYAARPNETGWKNSVRHNLTMNKCFIKISRAEGESGKGGYWMIDEAHAQAELGLEPRGGTNAGNGTIQSRTPPRFSSSSKARKHSRSHRKKKKSAAIVASFVDAKKKTSFPTMSPSSSSSSSSSVVPRLFGIDLDDPESATLLSLDDVPEIMLDSDSEVHRLQLSSGLVG